MSAIDTALLMLWPQALGLIVQERASRFFVGYHHLCVYPLSDITTRDQISQAFPPSICILEVIKYWRWERPGNEATSGLGMRLPLPLSSSAHPFQCYLYSSITCLYCPSVIPLTYTHTHTFTYTPHTHTFTHTHSHTHTCMHANACTSHTDTHTNTNS